MQYDLKKDLPQDAMVEITWHGDSTRVLLKHNPEAGKVDVNAGETIEVTATQARELLTYSKNWTLKGDKPLEKPKAQEEKTEEKKKDKEPEIDIEKLNVEEAKKLRKKTDVIFCLQKLEASFNDQASFKDLHALLIEKLEEREKGPQV